MKGIVAPGDMAAIVMKDDEGQPCVTTDGEKVVLDANTAFQHLIGFTLPELQGTKFVDLLPKEEYEKFEEHSRILAESGVSGIFVRLRTKGEFSINARLQSNQIAPGRFLTTVSHDGDRPSNADTGYGNRYGLALYEIGRQMTSSFDVDEVLKLVVKNVVWLLECHFVAVEQVDWASGTLTYREVIGNKSEITSQKAGVNGQGIAGRVILSQKPFIVECLSADPNLDVPEFEVADKESLQSAYGVPITNKGKQFGALVVGYRSDHKITEEEVQLTTNLANQAALALENATLYQQSVEYSKSMAALTSRLTFVQEEERRRITRELHDGIGQALTGLRLNLEILSRQVPIVERAAVDRVSMMKQIIDETLNSIRQIAFDLRPPILDDLGLISALRVYVDRYEERTNIVLTLSCPDHLKRFDPKIEATLYRVIQEGLTNVAKHSGAKSARVEIKKTESTLELIISDDGKGFDQPRDGESGLWSSGLGIINMKERVSGLGGKFSLESETGEGTTIRIEVPFHER